MQELLQKFAEWSNKNSGVSQLLIWIFGTIAAALGVYGHIKAKGGYATASSKALHEKMVTIFAKLDSLEDRMSSMERAVTLTETAIVRLASNQERIAALEAKLCGIQYLIQESRQKGLSEKAEEMDMLMAAINDLKDRIGNGA